MERTKDRSGWNELSPFAATPTASHLPQLLSDEPVHFLLVAGEQDDGSWGIVGAYWLASNTLLGGFFASPTAIWLGREMARSYRGAISRGWTEEQIFAYWAGQSGGEDAYMIDPVAEAGSLFEVARRVGAL